MFSPFDPFQASLVFSLGLKGAPLSTATLAALSGKSVEETEAALKNLARTGIVLPRDDGAWVCGETPDETMRYMAGTLRDSAPSGRPAHYLGHLGPDADLDDCEYVLAYLDKKLEPANPEALFCLETVLRFLLRWKHNKAENALQASSRYVELVLVAQSMCMFQQQLLSIALRLAPIAHDMTVRYGNELFRPLVNIFNAYLGIFSDEPLPRDAVRNMELLERDVAYGDAEFRSIIPLFNGMLHYVRGEYAQVVKYFEQKKDSYPWKYRRFSDLFDSCASQAAFYLGRHHISLGIVESQRSTAALTGDSERSLFWRLHLVFSQLRMGDPEQALENLDCLFVNVSARQFNKTANSAVRAVALYHFLSGNLKAAHTVLRSHIGEAVRKGLPHVPFEDPLNLDMLYCFERAGLPPVPRYELDAVLAHIRLSPNKQLRGAALRIEALRARDKGLTARHAVDLLRESVAILEDTEEPREIALSRHVLAQLLDETGDTRVADAIWRVLNPSAPRENGSHPPYQALAAWYAGNPPGSARRGIRDGAATASRREVTPPAPCYPTPALPVVEACRQAFASLTTETSTEALLHRLVTIAVMELKAERGALFAVDPGGGLNPAATINLTRVEMESADIREVVTSLARCGKKSSFHACPEGRRLCLILDTGPGAPWLMYLDNSFTDGLYADADPLELHVLSMLFAAEIRAALRLQSVRDEESRRQRERLSSMTEMEEKHIAPVFGGGFMAIVAQADQVSATDAAVLIQGETGVGKEVMARHIHQLSGRKGPFVAVHPASTPENLFESEFFGHERGAFTGAIRQKIGFFEMADCGTLFIDEAGDIPPGIQTKLLRVLQEQRFMRVGGTREIQSRFRLIAATNKDLRREVHEGRFREDLLYRINVVPLHLPPLRERRQDILTLIQFFLGHFSRKYNRPPLALNREQINSLYEYDWPGNIRELKNVIERAVILNNPHMTDTLRPGTKSIEKDASPLRALAGDFPTLEELERRYLQYVMEHASGRICGNDGMENILKIKRSTLYAKLKRHGISLR